jgi:hypothetical protein
MGMRASVAVGMAPPRRLLCSAPCWGLLCSLACASTAVELPFNASYGEAIDGVLGVPALYVELWQLSANAPTSCSAWSALRDGGVGLAEVVSATQLAIYTDGGPSVGPGTYQVTRKTVIDSWQAAVQISFADSGIQLVGGAGTVTVTAVGSAQAGEPFSATGSFDVWLIDQGNHSEDAGEWVGSFDPSLCVGLAP